MAQTQQDIYAICNRLSSMLLCLNDLRYS